MPASGKGNSNLSSGVSIFGDPLNSGILSVMLPPLPRNTVALGNARLKEYDNWAILLPRQIMIRILCIACIVHTRVLDGYTNKFIHSSISQVASGLDALWFTTTKYQGGHCNGVDTNVQCSTTT